MIRSSSQATSVTTSDGLTWVADELSGVATFTAHSTHVTRHEITWAGQPLSIETVAHGAGLIWALGSRTNGHALTTGAVVTAIKPKSGHITRQWPVPGGATMSSTTAAHTSHRSTAVKSSTSPQPTESRPSPPPSSASSQRPRPTHSGPRPGKGTCSGSRSRADPPPRQPHPRTSGHEVGERHARRRCRFTPTDSGSGRHLLVAAPATMQARSRRTTRGCLSGKAAVNPGPRLAAEFVPQEKSPEEETARLRLLLAGGPAVDRPPRLQ